ncbi:hypothetical protein [Exiguobacterium flavidum]|uniref:hypothetical protein n=1 Tax=Exiguobacterium flavidum TaxID=2184695 RepID=UPI000DF770DE|nr:hypothetical protein [Exiguobacterium flavidum]
MRRLVLLLPFLLLAACDEHDERTLSDMQAGSYAQASSRVTGNDPTAADKQLKAQAEAMLRLEQALAAYHFDEAILLAEEVMSFSEADLQTTRKAHAIRISVEEMLAELDQAEGTYVVDHAFERIGTETRPIKAEGEVDVTFSDQLIATLAFNDYGVSSSKQPLQDARHIIRFTPELQATEPLVQGVITYTFKLGKLEIVYEGPSGKRIFQLRKN